MTAKPLPTVDSIRKAFVRGDRSVAQFALDARMRAEREGRDLNAFAALEDEAVLEHTAADAVDGPLAGVPVGIKDMIDVVGLPTRCGSHVRPDLPAAADAQVVARLRGAGALPLGKTTTHEFAYGATGDITATGPVRNPRDRSRMAGGSSAGSAAAVGAGIVAAALGTDTGGSGRIPAAFCGIVGFRPTTGSISAEGVFPLAPTLDIVSPMATDVAGVRALWEAIRDADAPRPAMPSGRLSIGWLDTGPWSNLEPAIDAGVKHASSALREMGHTVNRMDSDWAMRTHQLYQLVQGPEVMATHHRDYIDRPHEFQPEVLERLHGAAQVTGWEYVQARAALHRLRHDIDAIFGDADVLLCATAPVTAPLIGQRSGFGTGRSTVWDVTLACTAPFSVLGVPAISLPAGVSASGLPGGVQLVGRPGADDGLLALAAALEAALAAS